MRFIAKGLTARLRHICIALVPGYGFRLVLEYILDTIHVIGELSNIDHAILNFKVKQSTTRHSFPAVFADGN